MVFPSHLPLIFMDRSPTTEMKGGQLNGNAFVSTERAKAYIEARRPQNAKPYLIPADAGLVSSVHEDELAATALFLGSDDSSFVNGIVLPVNGGMFT